MQLAVRPALNAIEGKPAKPRKKPPFPGQSGLFEQPTTVNNVETLAHVAWIARNSAQAFAAIGTAESKGTLLFTLGEEVRRPGVYDRRPQRIHVAGLSLAGRSVTFL